MRIERHAFRPMDYIGGDVVLDFVNTATGRDVAGRDWIADFAALIEWARLTRTWPAAAVDALAVRAAANPAGARSALERLKALRENLFAMLHAVVRGEAPDGQAVAAFEHCWRTARDAAALRFGPDRRLEVIIDADRPGLDWLLFDLAMRALALLESFDADRLKICAGSNCAWFFLDGSKAGRRRWCDMRTCGNAAKTRRHANTRRTARGAE